MALKVIIGLIVAAGVIGGGTWLATHKPAAEEPAATDSDTQADAAAGTFADLMARVGSWKCETRADFDGGSSEGVVYMNNSELRGDFTASVSGRAANTSFVKKDGYIYTWSDVLPQGMKVKTEAAAGTAGGQGIDPSTKVNYSCEVWIPDDGKFTLPANIQFFEIGTKGEGGFAPPAPN